MTTLKDASRELFGRSPDEQFQSLQDLWDHCAMQREASQDAWVAPQDVLPRDLDDELGLTLGQATYRMNAWSFSQVCKLAHVSCDTINRLSPATSARALAETLPRSGKPLQFLTRDNLVRAVHGASYTRLHHTDLLNIVREFATEFEPPQAGVGGGKGLYCGEQDMFCFLVDPTGWAEIDGEAFAPGLFLWNSEVGRRSVGVKTFWFQAICQNHIVWDAVNVVEFSRKHTSNVHESLGRVREILNTLVETRDARRDGFINVIRKAMAQQLGTDADDVLKVIRTHGITRAHGQAALKIAQTQGAFTVFSLVDALTRVSKQTQYAGNRVEVDQRAASLLSLVK